MITPFKEKKRQNKPKSPPQDAMLRFPKCGRNVNQNDNGKSNFTTHKAIITSLQKINAGEPGGRTIALSCWWEYTTAPASIMQASNDWKKTIKRD